MMRTQTISGRIAQAQGLYTAPRFRPSGSSLLRILGLIALLPVLAAMAMAVAITTGMCRLLGLGGRDGLSFWPRTLSEALGGYLARKASMPKPEIPVRDFRIRTRRGIRRLVRIQGHMTAGDLHVGDHVRLTGFEHYGTFYVRDGTNYTTGGRIMVRPH